MNFHFTYLLKLDLSMVLQNFIVEGDAKICFDAINDGTTVCPWIFSNLIHNITELKLD